MASSGKRTLKSAIGIAVLAALVMLAYETFHWFTHVYESGARVQTDLTKMSSRVDGTIDRIEVNEGDRVEQGELLIVLVDDDVRLNIEALQTDILLEQANRERLVSEREAFEIELRSKLATKGQQVQAIQVEHASIQDRLRLAENDLSRVAVLFKKKLTSEKEVAVEQDKVLILKGEAAMSRANIEIARKELEQVESTRKQLDVIEERIKISKLITAKLHTTLEREKVALNFRHIRSPVRGVIDRIYKHKGEYVEEGETILILHDEQQFWVEAFVDEDQIRHVRVGQVVDINFEAYPFEDYLGKVMHIGSLTTMEMGIAGNGAGRFGRSAERVPVRISVEQPPPNLTPGMLASINVRIYGD